MMRGDRSVLRHSLLPGCFAMLPVLLPAAAVAQAVEPGRVAQSTVGEAGQRQTREQAAVDGRAPMARLSSRIRNRVENRIRNRIDRYYNPQVDITSSFRAAENDARTARVGPRS